MADLTNPRSYRVYIELGVLVTVAIALVTAGFHIGSIYTLADSFDKRVTRLEGLNGLTAVP